ncbi:arginine decarboxylase [Quercus suber]|uniref:Arginine decarboxylase n=1 Tax=Quercus suber TaxID=58331 RepID=A0AAW0J1Q0_QUESU
MPAMACCVDPAAANFPPAYASAAAGPGSLTGLLIPPPTSHVEACHWSPTCSSELYKVDGWGAPYFAVNGSGNISVRPHGASTLPHQEIDLLKIVKKVSDPKSSGGLGLQLPLIVRLPDVLKNRLESLQAAFEYAVQSQGYEAHYQGVYPVKCNQDRFVVEDIVKFGSPFRFGLEAGSKPELLLAMSCLCKGNPEALLVCNGFKDAEYISLALVARKLALNTVIVLEQEEELDLVVDLSKRLSVKPIIGVRAKLRTKHSGHFGSTSGEKGKFGLTTTQILRVVKKLEQAGMIDCLQLLHFHIGSQIPSTALVADGVGEAAQIYCELVRLGAQMRVIDIGGGLGIDYDGSKSTESDISVGYTLGEYAAAVVQAIRFVCDRRSIKHPIICSESGRAIVSHHSVLIFEAVSASVYESPTMSSLGFEYLVNSLSDEAQADYMNLCSAAIRGDSETCLIYADQLKQRYVDQFKEGSLGIEQLAAVDGLCDVISKSIGAPDPVRTYHVNLSVFTSIPDFWGIGQLFPIVPIHRLEQKPSVKGILSDLTCDSDGKIDKFIGGDFAVTRAVPGPSCGDVLRVMQHEPELMFETLKHRAEECCNDSGNGIGMSALANSLAKSFRNMPYLVANTAASSSCGLTAATMNNNGFYYCNEDDEYNAAADSATTAGEDEWELWTFFDGYGYHGTSFEQTYRCYPASFIEKPQLESGDKIIMPPSALDRLASLHIDYPMLFELRNASAERVSHCGVLEFIAEEGMIYMPYWMMENMLLQEGDIVRVKNVTLPKGTYVKLQPHTKDFLDISNPKAILETTLRNFSCLTSGDSIMVAYNNKKYYIDIIETKPANAISIIETDCEVDFAPPLDYKEPEKPIAPVPLGKAPAEEAPAETEPKFSPFTGSGRRLDGKPLNYQPPSVAPSRSKDKQPNVANGNAKPSTGSSSQSTSRQAQGKLVFGSNVSRTPKDTPKEPAKETKQEQPSKSEEPKFQAFSGKKYSLRG